MLTFVFRHPLILALGVALIVLALYLAWRKHNLLLSGHLADGEVVELIPHRGSKGGTSYSLRVSYTQPDGTKGEFETSFSSNPPLHQLGEKIRVVCYPDAETPDILAFPDLFLFPWSCFCAGVFILLMCAGFAYGPSLIDSVYLPKLANPDTLKSLNLLK
ncbi:MAG: DUF3592 domain-containing protein [Methylacidiphilales bacterium]|nr:DUF3592 domain-containing protein [Candidatus Methylacidiphilales bacterium]